MLRTQAYQDVASSEGAMGWFSKTERATVSAEGESALRITEADGTARTIDVAALDWVGFLFVGDVYSPVYEGWWLFGHPTGATAIHVDCGAVDVLMRTSPIADIADGIADRVRIDVASRPRELRGRDAKNGVVHLAADAASNLRAKGVTERLSSVKDSPLIT